MKFINTIIKAIMLVYVVIFAFSNAGKATIVLIPKYFVYDTLVFVPVLGALFVGGILVALGFAAEHMRLRKELKNTNRNLTRAEEELKRLRTLPLLQNSDNSNKDS